MDNSKRKAQGNVGDYLFVITLIKKTEEFKIKLKKERVSAKWK